MNILIADDDPVTRRLLEAHLVKWGYEVVAASNGTEAWEVLEKDDHPTLAILDWMMPGKDGVQVCRAIRKRGKEPYIYIVLLTGRGQRQDIIEGLDAGADDYLTKPFDPYELRARVRAGARIIELQEQLIVAREALRLEATHDSLTGLWNRSAILENLHREIARGERDASPVGVLMADIDHFKTINDTHGHPAGDAVLREVARRLRSSIRPYDEIGRYGGEEFLIVTPGCGATNALKQAERLRARVGINPVEIFEGAVPVTLSVGVVASEGRNVADSIIRAADEALYRAKSSGRNRVELFEGGLAQTDLPPAQAQRDLLKSG